MNDIFKLRENIYNQSPKLSHLPDRHSCSLKYGLHVIPYPACQLWKQVPIDISKAASLAFLKTRIKIWK